MTPIEAITKYNEAELSARTTYRDYWLEKFKAAGILLTARGETAMVGILNGYELDAWVWPRQFDGIKIEVKWPVGQGKTYREVKVKSDSGFNKLVRRLILDEFK